MSAALFAFNFLLNALWQIPLVFCAAYLAVRLMRGNGPQWEHRIWVGALILELLLPLGRLNFHSVATCVLALFASAGFSAGGSVRVFTTTAPISAPAWHLSPAIIAFALTAWAVTILYFTARFFWRLHKTSLLRRNAHTVSSTDYPTLQNFLCESSAMPQLLVSQFVSGPAIVGALRPALLLPSGFLDRTAPADIEAALAHEFAHLRRRDYAKNLAYEFITSLIAWHPLVWLTHSRIAESREILCDYLAAHSTSSRQDYARALLRLASQQSGRMPQTIQAIGIFDTQSFERRIMKLTQSQIHNSVARRLLTVSACAVLAIATAASALALHVDAATSPVYTKQSSSKPVYISPGVIARSRIGGAEPTYPAEAKKKHIQGMVVLAAQISKEGAIYDLKVISGPKILAASAVKAVHTWRYKPYLLNGEPVEVKTTIHVVYSLGDNGNHPKH